MLKLHKMDLLQGYGDDDSDDSNDAVNSSNLSIDANAKPKTLPSVRSTPTNSAAATTAAAAGAAMAAPATLVPIAARRRRALAVSSQALKKKPATKPSAAVAAARPPPAVALAHAAAVSSTLGSAAAASSVARRQQVPQQSVAEATAVLNGLLPGPGSESLVDVSVSSKIRAFHEKRKQGTYFNAHMKKLKSFRNPGILAKLVQSYELYEYGTAYPPRLWDPTGLPKGDVYPSLRAEQERSTMVRSQKQLVGGRASIEFAGSSSKSAVDLIAAGAPTSAAEAATAAASGGAGSTSASSSGAAAAAAGAKRKKPTKKELYKMMKKKRKPAVSSAASTGAAAAAASASATAPVSAGYQAFAQRQRAAQRKQ